jgi:tungstate transport system substrate-binding protein
VKTIIKLLLVVSLIAMLAGCSTAAVPTATSIPAPTVAPAKPTTPPAVPTAAPAVAPTATLPPAKPPSPGLLRLATTTSTADTGLLTAILPLFEKVNNVKVDVVAVGSGQAIEIGSKGDADVLLVHSRAAEDKFVTDGHAKARFDVMYNDYVLVGPKEDPAKVTGMATAKDAFKAIMDAKAIFVSRGDKSGTNTKELGIWTTLGITPTKDMTWYNSIGQGMGDTLLFSNEKKGYTLADRGTWLAMKDKVPALVIVVGGNTLTENQDKTLLNPYGVLAVDPVKHPGVNSDLSAKFVTWILSPEAQKAIGAFGVDKFGQQLFYPSAK